MPHSLVHNIQQSRCTTPWDAMEGSDVMRTCSLCKANVYKIEGLDADEVSSLIRTGTPESEHETIKLYRRKDGTVTTSPNTCSLSRGGAAIGLAAAAGMYAGIYHNLEFAQSAVGTIVVFSSYNLLYLKLKRAIKISDLPVLFVLLMIMNMLLRFITDINIFRIAFPALILAAVLSMANLRIRAWRKQKIIALQRTGSGGGSLLSLAPDIQPKAHTIDTNILPCEKGQLEK